MKHLFVSLVLLSFTSLSQAFDRYLYCEADNTNFLSLDIRENLFSVEYGNSIQQGINDFETDELIETKFTIKAIDHKKTRVFMFNKYTDELRMSFTKSSYKFSKDNNWRVQSGWVYQCVSVSRPKD